MSFPSGSSYILTLASLPAMHIKGLSLAGLTAQVQLQFSASFCDRVSPEAAITQQRVTDIVVPDDLEDLARVGVLLGGCGEAANEDLMGR